MILRLKILINAFINIKDKKHLIYNIYYALKRGGISELRKNIIETSTNTKLPKMKLYEKQLKEEKVVCKSIKRILFIIDTQGKENDALTVKSVEEQMRNEDKIEICSLNRKNVQEVIERMKCEYVFFIKGGNYISPNFIAEVLNRMDDENCAALYSDECIYSNTTGEIIKYIVKPDFSTYDLYNNLSIGQCIVFSSQVLLEIGSLDDSYVGFEEKMQIMLVNISLAQYKIIHLEKILLLINERNSVVYLNEKKRIFEKIINYKGTDANVIIRNEKARLQVFRKERSVSIIIIGKEKRKIEKCLMSIIQNTDYENYEIILVLSAELENKLELDIDTSKIRFINVDNSQNTYITQCNAGAKESVSELVMFMQDYLTVENKDWLTNIVAQFKFDYIGGVSPKIVRKDNTIRYAGIISGGFDFYPIPFNGEMDFWVNGQNDLAFINREVTILSGSCLCILRKVYEQMGDLTESVLEDKFSNAVLSYNIKRQGYSCIFCSDTTLIADTDEWYDSWYDNESRTGYLYLLKEYGEELSYDPFFTYSMKVQYLRNVPIEYKICKKKNISETAKSNILIISHDSFLGGATIALQYASRALIKNGYDVVWIFGTEGPIQAELEKEKISYIIDPTFRNSNTWLKYADKFDLFLVSTLVLSDVVAQLINENKRIFWWIHEASDYYTDQVCSKINPFLSDKLNVFCGGAYAQKIFNARFPNLRTKILLYGIPDFANKKHKVNNNFDKSHKVHFLSVGTIEKRKGQDILADAIDILEPEHIRQCDFCIIGKAIDKKIFDKLVKIREKYSSNIEILEPISREELMEKYEETDVVICTSREDPMPVFMTECLMQSKIALCSENTGTASILQDGANGFIYKNNSALELAQKIKYLIEHKEEFSTLKVNARKTYEKYFDMDIFENNLVEIMENIL